MRWPGSRHFVAGIILALVLWARGVKMPSRESWRGHALLGVSDDRHGQRLPRLGSAVRAERSGRRHGVGDSVLDDRRRGADARRRENPPQTVLGLLLGFGGIVLLASSSLNNNGASTTQIIFGVIMLQLSCFGWSLGSAYAKRHKREEHLFAATAMQIVLGGVVLMIVATITGRMASGSSDREESAGRASI